MPISWNSSKPRAGALPADPAPVKVGVIGVGHLGSRHARIYSELPRVDLLGVVDIEAGRAERVAADLRVPGWSDWRRLPDTVEAVSLAVPTALHGPLGVEILESGLDLLVEKPITATLEEADLLVETARRHGRILMVGHTERFNPAVEALRRVISRPRFIETERMASFAPRSLDIDVVLDLMIHDLDLLLMLAGPEVEEIRAIGINAFTDKVDIANARIRFASGCVANLTASRISRERVRKLRIFQDRSYFSLDFAAQQVIGYRLLPAVGGFPSVSQQTLEVEPGEPLRRQLDRFAEVVRSRETAPCTGEDGSRALRLAHRILEEMRA